MLFRLIGLILMLYFGSVAFRYRHNGPITGGVIIRHYNKWREKTIQSHPRLQLGMSMPNVNPNSRYFAQSVFGVALVFVAIGLILLLAGNSLNKPVVTTHHTMIGQ